MARRSIWAQIADPYRTPGVGQSIMDSISSQTQGWANYLKGGSYMPKFDGTSDPYYQMIASQTDAARQADAANRRANIRNSLIAFGMVPQGYGDKYGDIDQATRDAIQKNTDTGISTYARLLGARQEANTALMNRIGARGLFRSGAKGHGLRKNQLEYDRSLADSLAQLMQNVNGFNSSYANNELARQNALASALAQAYQNYVPPSTDPFSYISTIATGGVAPRATSSGSGYTSPVPTGTGGAGGGTLRAM